MVLVTILEVVRARGRERKERRREGMENQLLWTEETFNESTS